MTPGPCSVLRVPRSALARGVSMLEVTNLRVAYGQIEAVKGVSFRVPVGSIVTLVGANGAGKTTTLAAISGLLRPRAGGITFEGRDLTRMGPHRIVRLGV